MTWLWLLVPAGLLLLFAGGRRTSGKEFPKSRNGHWIYHPHVVRKDDYECSRCHARFPKESSSCPGCGAKMTGKTEKNEDEWFEEEEKLDLILDDD